MSPNEPAPEIPAEILAAYDRVGAEYEWIPAGHINLTFRVTQDERAPLLVQRINHHVFRQPEEVMANTLLVTGHIRRQLAHACGSSSDSVARRCLEVLPTLQGSPWALDEDGWTWRSFRFIDDTVTRQRARTSAEASAAAQAFGQFQRQLEDFDVSQLHETIVGFHDTPSRFQTLERSIEENRAGRLRAVASEVDEMLSYRGWQDRLSAPLATGDLPTRAVHNDAKLSNLLLDASSDEPLCVIDLDTVMPGTALFDFGELVRSMSHRTAEDERDRSRISIDPELFGALARGYLASARPFLSTSERELLFDAGFVLILENGVRFLTDYLDGDVYYRTSRPTQNLDRTTSHLALLESMIAQEDELRLLCR